MNNKQKLIERFYAVKKLGYVKSNRKNTTGIGKTFEDYIGVVENNLDEPDLFGFEIKAHREISNSFITLCTKSPSFPNGANSYLNQKYGIPYEDNPCLHKLHTSIFANNGNSFNGLYSFRLENDIKNKVIRIVICDLKTKCQIEDSCG